MNPPSQPRQPSDRLRSPGAAFLLSQIGWQSSRLWHERLNPLGIDARGVVVLRHIAAGEGCTQQSLGRALRVPTSRVVALVDDLEAAGMLERRPNERDRRAHALHLTRHGKRVLERVMRISADHENDICAALKPRSSRKTVS